MDRNHYYSIGEVAATCNTSIKTLRYYDEIKLVVPEVRKEEQIPLLQQRSDGNHLYHPETAHARFFD